MVEMRTGPWKCGFYDRAWEMPTTSRDETGAHFTSSKPREVTTGHITEEPNATSKLNEENETSLTKIQEEASLVPTTALIRAL